MIAPESRVRTGLPAGGSGTRTLGPSPDPVNVGTIALAANALYT